MFYFPILSSGFNKNEYRKRVVEKLKEIKPDIDSLVAWDKKLKDEDNLYTLSKEDKEKYNEDYIELQKLINKILGEDI